MLASVGPLAIGGATTGALTSHLAQGPMSKSNPILEASHAIGDSLPNAGQRIDNYVGNAGHAVSQWWHNNDQPPASAPDKPAVPGQPGLSNTDMALGAGIPLAAGALAYSLMGRRKKPKPEPYAMGKNSAFLGHLAAQRNVPNF
jgi:hypothetical protein